jgi:hypothetical protein
VLRDASGRSRDAAAEPRRRGRAPRASARSRSQAVGACRRRCRCGWCSPRARRTISSTFARASAWIAASARGQRVVVACHAPCCLVGAWLRRLAALPWLAVVALATLLARAAHGVSKRRALLKPKQLGRQELAFGSLVVVLLALGYALGV